MVQAVGDAARPRGGADPARAAAIADALGEGRLAEVVRRIAHAALLAHLRELFSTTGPENLASALRSCAALLGPGGFAPCLAACLAPPTAAFGAALAAKLPHHLAATAVAKLVAANDSGKVSDFEWYVMALHNAVARGEPEQLLNPYGPPKGGLAEEEGYADYDETYYYDSERERR